MPKVEIRPPSTVNQAKPTKFHVFLKILLIIFLSYNVLSLDGNFYIAKRYIQTISNASLAGVLHVYVRDTSVVRDATTDKAQSWPFPAM
jgi:hypothetical protein